MPTVAYSAVPSHENGGDPTNTTPKEELPHFTWRAVGVGITIGALLCFTNMYFGLQTGWISMMSLQSSLLGFAIFKVAKPYLTVPFGPAENIVLQSIAVATGTMPLAAGFVGIIPALQMMNTDDNPPRNGKEGGPIVLSATELILWCLAIAFFGVFIAVPLRKQVIVKEKLPFPSGTATAQMIGVLHNTPLKVHDHHSNEDSTPSTLRQRRRHGVTDDLDDEEQATAILHVSKQQGGPDPSTQYQSTGKSTALNAQTQAKAMAQNQHQPPPLGQMTPLGSSANFETSGPGSGSGSTPEPRSDDTLMIEGEGGEFSLDKSFLQEDTWRTNMVALGISFTVSGLYTVLSYFVPVIAAIPVFDWLIPGSVQFGATWQWFFTPSLSYLGQGIIMGFPTTAAMLLGCVIGWGILSPIATLNKWVTGPVSSATSGARGWILWISLGVMIVESVVSLLGVVILSLIAHYRYSLKLKRVEERRKLLESSMRAHPGAQHNNHDRQEDDYDDYDDYDDAPADQLVPLKIWVCGLILSSFLCLFLIWVLFKDQHMPLYATAAALLLGSLLSVLGVRALGSTDLNPVSGIGKVSQFIFGGIVPGGIVANLVAGGIAEAGAQQAGDLMQDLKTGHLMGASPKAQFWGQLIGSLASVFISTGVYKLYSTAYELPGPQFAVPTAKVWLDLARLVNGHSLPEHTGPFILGFSFLFAGLTILTTIYSDAAFLRKLDSGGGGKRPKWLKYIPSGIAFAIGMYNLPNFTLARFLGGLVSIWWDWHCKKYAGQPNTRFANLGRVFLIIIASGFVLGEGTLSIVNLILKTFDVHSWSCAGCVEGICVCN